MFRKYIDIALVMFLIVGALGLAVGVVFTNRPATVAAMPAGQSVTVQVDGFQSHLPLNSDMLNNAVSPKNVYPIVKIKNEIRVELLSVQIDGGFLSADICFDFPSDDPAWSLGGPDNLKLSNGVAEIGVYSIEMIPDPQSGFLKKDDKGRFAGRCDHVGFPLSAGFALENLKISIGELVTDAPETPDCNKVQAKLDSKSTGIKIKCASEPGTSGVEIAVKPKELDTVQAQKILMDVLTESADGPWEFEVGTP
ncbi:MAG: hypothetical protein IT313_02885 [Anaerolineales bacterium]|nr:hypothetical protein [Anaerolineales bacterium]